MQRDHFALHVGMSTKENNNGNSHRLDMPVVVVAGITAAGVRDIVVGMPHDPYELSAPNGQSMVVIV